MFKQMAYLSCLMFQVVGVRGSPSQWRNGTEISPLCPLGQPEGESTTAAAVGQVVAPRSLSADFFHLEVDDAIIPNPVWVLTPIPPSQNPAWHRTTSPALPSQRFTITLLQPRWLVCTTPASPRRPRQQACRQPTAACPPLPWRFRLFPPPVYWRATGTAPSGSALSAWWSSPSTASRPSRPASTGRACSACGSTFRSRSASRASTWPARSAMSSFTRTTCVPFWRTAGWWASTKTSCCDESWPWILTRVGVQPPTVGEWCLPAFWPLPCHPAACPLLSLVGSKNGERQNIEI